MTKPTDRLNLAKRSRGDIGLQEIADAVGHYLQHGDWSRMTSLVVGLGDADGALVREIFARCLSGVEVVRSSTHPSGWMLKKVGAVIEGTVALNRVETLASEGHSFRSRIVARELALSTAFVADYDLDAALARLVKRAQEAGKSVEVIAELEHCRKRIFRLDR